MARVLLIDDETVIRELIAEILVDAGHAVHAVASAAEGLACLEAGDFQLIVSDIVMPGLSGLELLAAVRETRPSLPVVLVTGAGTHAMISDALAGGADGLVMKPFSHADLNRAVTTALERSGRAEREVRTRLLAPSLAAALANAIEARDSTTHGHCERMSAIAVAIAVELGLSPSEIETVRLGAILHDVGKIGIPDRVLIKDGVLTDEERALMRTHPLIGDRLLEPLDLLASVRPVVLHHHESWDGSGYPDGLAGNEIPLAARIVALADAVEAMSGVRTYRPPMESFQIVNELEAGSGVQWDPALVAIVLRLTELGRLRFEADGLVQSDPRAAPDETLAHAVLLVEDDRAHAKLARAAIERALEHVAITHATDVASALNLCRGATWSLVVVDHYLPDGNGIELMETLHELFPQLPVVVMTADDSTGLAVEAFRRGATDYVVKSDAFLDELARRVETIVGGPVGNLKPVRSAA